MERKKQWPDMGEHFIESLHIVPPYAKKLEKTGGWAVIAPVQCGKQLRMSPIKKIRSEKQCLEYIATMQKP